jgi:hypothetical protein
MDFASLKPNFHSVDCQKELTRLTSLRNCLCDAITKSESHKHALDEFALQDCHEYHAALLAFEKKGFPTRDEGSNLELTWSAARSASKGKAREFSLGLVSVPCGTSLRLSRFWAQCKNPTRKAASKQSSTIRTRRQV